MANCARALLIDLLHFPRINDRYDALESAHYKTYDWALQQDSRTAANWTNFAQWLGSRNASDNVYWITGEPGSGKSTLMKHLSTSEATMDHLTQWSDGQPVMLAQCYFWAPGTDLQKSKEGLIRTLSLQMMSDDLLFNSAIEHAFPTLWVQAYAKSASSTLSVHDLKTMFQSILDHVMLKSKILLFVDGLDEYGQNRDERKDLIELFLTLQGLPQIKMCVSSRPWNVFNDAFRGFPHLRLEELNRPDIERCVTDKCDQSNAFQTLKQISPDRAKKLQDEIVQKSRGVFLWVYLVLKRLLSEMQDGLGLIEPENILAEVPEGLDRYFEFMLRRIPEDQKVQASRVYQITGLLGGTIGLETPLLLSYVKEVNQDFAERHKDLGGKDTEIRTAAMHRFLHGQSMDLLVCRRSSTPPAFPCDDFSIEFLHRTAAEYVRSTAVQSLLRMLTGGAIDINRYAVNFLLSQIFLCRNFAPVPTGEQSSQLYHYVMCLVGSMEQLSAAHMIPAYRLFSEVASFVLTALKMVNRSDCLTHHASLDDA